MAAIDLQRGLEHGGRGWGQERPELIDGFDSEMQEWEDQLQDMQRKIEELYNEVQARRGGNDVTIGNRKNGGVMDFGPAHHRNGFFDMTGCHSNGSKDHPKTVTMPNHHSNGCNYGANGYGYPASHQSGYGYPHSNGGSEIGDLLQDYLGQGKGMSRKNNRARHVHFDDNSKLSQDLPVHQDEIKRKPGNEKIGQERFAGCFEEAENKKNQVSHAKSFSCKEGSPNKENTDAKPPLRQRDAHPVPPRTVPHSPANSPAIDRKSYNPGVLVDRKGSSPSVLRKFGAMLQENEGKTLTDTGVVTQQTVASEPKCPTPGCHRKGLGATTAAGRAPTRVPPQKCQVDSSELTAEMEPSQEWGAVVDSGRHSQNMEQRGGYGHPKGPQQSQRRAQVPGNPKPRPRAYSGTDRDIGVGQGEKARRPAPQLGEPRGDYRVLHGSSGAQRSQRVGLSGQSGQGRDDGLIELLDMLEIEHKYSSSPRTGHATHRQDPQQVSPAELSPATPMRSFSRPARPANQRPPSRWASCTPTARITAPSGPLCRPPSPLARPSSPLARTASPALKQRQSHFSYSLHTETVIM